MAEAEAGQKKMGCLKIGGIIGGVLVLLLVIGAMFGEDEATEQAAQASSEPPVEVTAQDLAAAYDSNEVAAQQQYGGKRLLVKGTIDGITLDLMDDPVVMLQTGDQFMNAQAALAEASKGQAASLSKGQTITLLCNGVSEVIGTPMLSDCEIR